MSERTGAPMTSETRTPAQQEWDRQLGLLNMMWPCDPVDRVIWRRAEEVAASVAALADRVAGIERGMKTISDSVQSLDRDFVQMRDRLAALESPAAAPEGQGRTPECIERFIDILTEHLETETKPERIEAFTLYRDLAREELARKAAAPEPVCRNCGHERSFHTDNGNGPCLHSPNSHAGYCGCMPFVPAEPPAAVPDAAPTEKVLVAMQTLYEMLPGPMGDLATAIRDEWHMRTGQPNVVTDAAIRAYGRDGAR